MLAWAEKGGVTLVNVHEVLSRAGLPGKYRAFATELAKRTTEGFSAASDVLRFVLMRLFGGVCTEIDNEMGDGLTEQIAETLRTAEHGFGGPTLIPDPIAMTPGHPLATLHLELLAGLQAPAERDWDAGHE